MSDLTRKEKAKAMRNGQMKMEREGCDWSIEDDIVLREMFGDGEDVLDIAFALARKEPAVQQRIDRLGLYRKQKRNRRKLFLTDPPGCLCKHCTVDKEFCPRCIHYQGNKEEV